MKIGSKALGLSILTVLALVALAGSIFLNHKAGFSKRKASQLQVATVPRTPRVFPPVSTGDWSPGSTPPPPAEILTGSLWRSRLEAILKDKAKAMGERDLPPFGLRVLEVFPEGQAQELGITVGDRFLKFNNTLILGNVEFQIARAMTPGKLEVWSPGTGTHDVTVREGRFGVRWEAEWNIHSAYLQSPERDARWDDFVLGACLSWRIDGDAAETALFHAQRAGYHGWITWAIMSRLCHEALHHNEAMAFAWFAKDLAPADGKGPILESFYKSALLLGRLDWALRVCRENPDYYLGCEGWDWTAQRNWHRKLETLPSGQPTPCLLASDPQIPSQPVRGLDNNGEILAGPFRRGIPNSFIYAPSRSFMMFFGPPARNPAFSMEFVMETNENGNEDRPPSVQFSIVDISSGVDEELARIELQQNGTTTVSGSSLPHITTSGAGFFAHDKVLLDIALVGPRCEMRLNGRCAFLGVVPDRPGRELALAVRLWNLKGQFFYIDRKELHGGGGGMIEKTVPSSSPPLPAGGTPLPMPTWYDEEILGAYLKGGARMVTWDEKALETLRLAVPYLKNRSDCTNLQNILLSARQAFQTGCDDPLVLFILDLVHHDVSGTRDWDVTWKFRRSLTRLRERAYPAVTKCWLLLHAISDWEGGAGLRLSSNVQQIAEEVLALIPSAMAERGVPTRVLVEILKKLCESLPESDQKPLSAFQTVYNAAEQGRPGTAAARAFKGTFYIRYAWDARGSGWADTVSEEGWKLFHERLAVAATCFEEAWKLDPSDPTAPSGMLTVALGNEGARKDFQLWWKRAIDVEPDDTDAAERVLHVLMPRWLGSPETLLEFGQECFSRAKRENLRPCIALLLLRAHETLLTPGSSIGLTPSEELRLREKYWEQSAVWQDVQKVFSWVLKNHPESEYYRSLYAYYAGRCARWKEAHDQFEQLGDSVAWSAFGGQEQGVLTRRLSRNWRP